MSWCESLVALNSESPCNDLLFPSGGDVSEISLVVVRLFTVYVSTFVCLVAAACDCVRVVPEQEGVMMPP